MGRKSENGGVYAKGLDRIELAFSYEGKRYRPTLKRKPTEANLRRARLQLEGIRDRIDAGTFNFAEEFPSYRFRHKLPASREQPEPVAQPEPEFVIKPPSKPERTCDDVFDAFLRHCEVRVASSDMAFSTLNSYRKILKRNWRPKLGKREFKSITYSELVEIAGSQGWKTKKTYNNGISPLRCAFEFGYKDHRGTPNPAEGLDSFRITKMDRPEIDPFSIYEAEKLILGVHDEWGEAQGNFDEFRFFTALRQSEEISLRVPNCDLAKGTIKIERVVVLGRDKNRPKNNEPRTVELCPRALSVLRRQLALRGAYVRAGKIHHDFVFFKSDGAPMRGLKYPYVRWVYVVEKLGLRYREPYNARHSFVSWCLMTGKNPLWCSKQFGHGVQVMFERYGTWIEGASEADIEATRHAMQKEAVAIGLSGNVPSIPPEPPEFATRTPLDQGWGRLSWRKAKHFKRLTGGADGTRTRDPRRDRPVF